MEKFPKFIKKAAKIAAIASVGFMSVDSEAKAQNAENPRENKIEVSHELTNQIFSQIEKNFDLFLENSEAHPYFYYKEKNGYEVKYDLDANSDGEKDDFAKIAVTRKDGNTNYVLEKNTESGEMKNIVFNYTNEAFDNAKTDTYENFFAQYKIVLLDLYGDKQHPIKFRELSENEKTDMLQAIQKMMNEEISNGIVTQKNLENIQKFEQRKGERGAQENQEKNLVKSAEKLLDLVKKAYENSEDKGNNPISFSNTVKSGMYTYEFNPRTFAIFFTDKEGNRNEIKLKLGSESFFSELRKIAEKEGNISIQDLSPDEVENILRDAAAELQK
jgi:hypothetical protein